MSWLQTFVRIFKIHDLRMKVLFIFGVFLIFRIMANIPIPGIQAERLKDFFSSNQVFGLLNVFTGGALDNLSIVMLGLGPYITATIVLQLLTMVFPRLNQMYKEEGEAGRQKFNQYGRMLTIPFALIQLGYEPAFLSYNNALVEEARKKALVPEFGLACLEKEVAAIFASENYFVQGIDSTEGIFRKYGPHCMYLERRKL